VCEREREREKEGGMEKEVERERERERTMSRLLEGEARTKGGGSNGMLQKTA
jgi:hypothetical protein